MKKKEEESQCVPSIMNGTLVKMDEAYREKTADIQITIEIEGSIKPEEEIEARIVPQYTVSEKTSRKTIYAATGETIEEGRMPSGSEIIFRMNGKTQVTKMSTIDFHGYEDGTYVYKIEQRVSHAIDTQEQMYCMEVQLVSDSVAHIEVYDGKGDMLEEADRKVKICFHDISLKKEKAHRNYTIEMERVRYKMVVEETDDIEEVIDVDATIIPQQIQEKDEGEEMKDMEECQSYVIRRGHGRYTQKGIEMIENMRKGKVDTRVVQVLSIMLFTTLLFRRNRKKRRMKQRETIGK